MYQSKMVSPQKLQLFCEFLENRLHTSSFALLRRMMADFCAGNEHTLQDFMRLGAAVVSVMPVERTGPRHLNAAAGLLAAQRAENVRDEGVTDTPNEQQEDNSCFFLYLYARVATKNILWLREMFREFCQGDDTVVREFVRCAYAAIVVIPVDVRALCMAPLPPPPLAIEAASRFPTTRMDTLLSGTPSSILTVFKRVEAKEPRKEIFKPENLSMPFSRVRHPELYSVLKEFWLKYGRAVWERNFWAPLSRQRTWQLHTNRRCRQLSLVNFFEKNVITPVYKKLGASFFVTMDARSPRNGWFYFDQAVDLFTLAQRYGLATCLEYIESQAFKRFPEAPGQSRTFVLRRNGKSRSMWSSSEQLKPILAEMEAYEAKSDKSSNLPSSTL
ncbi:hypothetical protein P3T76_012753 [Phytophthora citrophthora]|uniref:Uncharacterized protein n=1 Tax=Phytophthora citrophthora TaxID=4793 RepID=A0AAD9LCW6_9STRA|nr:hypothetical protein P3T76_012753 [Phytophthora citrophthora]